MTTSDDQRTTEHRTQHHTDDGTVTERVVHGAPPPAERVQVQPVTVDDTRKLSFTSFLVGFVSAIVAGAIAIVVFFAVSDADDDGNIELDVPAVDVDTGG